MMSVWVNEKWTRTYAHLMWSYTMNNGQQITITAINWNWKWIDWWVGGLRICVCVVFLKLKIENGNYHICVNSIFSGHTLHCWQIDWFNFNECRLRLFHFNPLITCNWKPVCLCVWKWVWVDFTARTDRTNASQWIDTRVGWDRWIDMRSFLNAGNFDLKWIHFSIRSRALRGQMQLHFMSIGNYMLSSNYDMLTF